MFKLLFVLIIIGLKLGHAYALEVGQKEFCLLAGQTQAQDQKEILEELAKKDFKVDSALKASLQYFFYQIVVEFDLRGPLILKMKPNKMLEKVKVQGSGGTRTLYFSQDADKDLLGNNIEKLAKNICSQKSSSTTKIPIQWSNTLLEQIARLIIPDNKLRENLEKKTGWIFESPKNDKDYNFEQNFSKDELVTIMKILMDLPQEVVASFHLKYMTRQKVGLSATKFAGIYDRKKQKITLNDLAFLEHQSVYGEDAVLHEFGHAWWVGQNFETQKKFINLSWSSDGKNWTVVDKKKNSFVSNYARTSPEDDFAETFASYVYEPEKLQSISNEKYAYMKKIVFMDTQYEAIVPENAKVYIASELTDKEAPKLDQPLHECLRFRITKTQKHSSKIGVELRCVAEFMSGLDESYLTLENITSKSRPIIIKLIPQELRVKGETWTLKGEVEVSESQIVSGEYKATMIPLKDKAGNVSLVSGEKSPSVYLFGTRIEERETFQTLDWSRVMLKKSKIINGHQGYTISLPLTHEPKLQKMTLVFYHTRAQEKSIVNILASHKNEFVSKSEDKETVAEFFIRNENIAGELVLQNVVLSFADKHSKNNERQFTPNKDSSISIVVDGTRDYRAELNLDQLKLWAVKQNNPVGGSWNIALSTPIIKDQNFDLNIYAYLRSPNGSKLVFNIDERDRFINGINLLDSKGNTSTYQMQFPLKIHPEKGVYVLEALEVQTIPKFNNKDPLNIEHLKVSKKYQLSERGIKRVIYIEGND